MTDKAWIALADYSLKYKVSISTLRRRIKNQDVEYKIEEGKYLLRDTPFEASRKLAEAPPPVQKVASALAEQKVPIVPPTQMPSPVQPSDRGEVQLLVGELKKAYSTILQEKDQQILQLRDEVTDLQTLARVLEEENERLKNVIKDSCSLDQWLKAPTPLDAGLK